MEPLLVDLVLTLGLGFSVALDGSKLFEREDPDKAVDTLYSTSVENSFGMIGVSKGRTAAGESAITTETSISSAHAVT